ncbi:hypothetical protein caldi_14810 [Caldinitratiruptor microaerophilus]|uniref:Uncharacterized protein n=1 Tax=Caldinitratiruptor microaerophilus TaxID=671077 RepID=A0AA35G5Y7_9FIRM|nr:hypothetical protein caldi_14810 [Caldinitratiruptor microaerophilus]
MGLGPLACLPNGRGGAFHSVRPFGVILAVPRARGAAQCLALPVTPVFLRPRPNDEPATAAGAPRAVIVACRRPPEQRLAAAETEDAGKPANLTRAGPQDPLTHGCLLW